MKRLLFAVLIIIIALFAWADWPPRPLQGTGKADFVLVEKQSRTLTLYRDGHPLRQYAVALGKNPVGAKGKEGDNKTPEGVYTITAHNPASTCYLALHLSYPEQRDLRHSHSRDISPGGDIMIHGIKNGFGFLGRIHRWRDWTAGCIAVTDPEMSEIYRLVPDGCRVEIRQ